MRRAIALDEGIPGSIHMLCLWKKREKKTKKGPIRQGNRCPQLEATPCCGMVSQRLVSNLHK